MKIGGLKPEYDLALADLIRVNLKNHSLDAILILHRYYLAILVRTQDDSQQL